MTFQITSPVSGEIVPLQNVLDPVFAQGIVGPGIAVEPSGATTLTAVAPVAGIITSMMPHAFVIQADSGAGVLVHLGLDTVELKGAGFTLLAEAGTRVAAGTPLVEWDTAPARAAGKSLVVPVVVLQAEGQVSPATDERRVEASSPLLNVEHRAPVENG